MSQQLVCSIGTYVFGRASLPDCLEKWVGTFCDTVRYGMDLARIVEQNSLLLQGRMPVQQCMSSTAIDPAS